MYINQEIDTGMFLRSKVILNLSYISDVANTYIYLKTEWNIFIKN